MLFVDTIAAANGLTLSNQSRDTLAISRWLYLVIESTAIGASALLASFVTDRVLIRYLHSGSHTFPAIEQWWRPFVWIDRGLPCLG